MDSQDPAPVEIVNPAASAPLLLIVDHAGNAVPRSLQSGARPLGISAAEMQRHIAWDIGAAGVARGLAHRLGATAVLSVYSRLVIDPNRALGDVDCIPAKSDGISIPANANLSYTEICARASAYYWPYHTAVDVELGRLKHVGHIPLLIAVHTFTPALATTGVARPWHVGILTNRDERLAQRLVGALRKYSDMTVGVNEPYSGITHGYCMKVHGLAQGLPHAQIEVRQDLVADVSGQEKWADLLAEVLRPIVAAAPTIGIAHY